MTKNNKQEGLIKAIIIFIIILFILGYFNIDIRGVIDTIIAGFKKVF